MRGDGFTNSSKSIKLRIRKIGGKMIIIISPKIIQIIAMVIFFLGLFLFMFGRYVNHVRARTKILTIFGIILLLVGMMMLALPRIT